MLQKIKTIFRHPYIHQLRDVRVLGMVVFAFIALMVSWSGIKAIQTNYELQRQIAKLEQQNKLQDLENTNMRLKNQYLETDEFLELAARRQFGKAAPGEKVIIVPKDVGLSYYSSTSQQQSPGTEKPTAHKPGYRRNFEAWINFFLHRQEKSS